MRRTLNTRAWRELPRDGVCAVHALTGDQCAGALALHHAHPVSLGGDEAGPLVLVCRRHHPQLEALARRLYGRRLRRCPHTHRTREGREACERRLNRLQTAA